MGALDRIARDLQQLRGEIRGLAGGVQLAHSSLEDGALTVNDAEGTTRMLIGLQHDGTQTAAVIAGPPPPQPAPPTGRAGPGILTITWDGQFIGPAGQPDPYTVAPMDYARTEVHISREHPDFAPTRDTLIGTIESPAGGEVPYAPLTETGDYHARLIARSQAGKESTPSDPVTITVALADLVGELERLEGLAEGAMVSASGKNRVHYGPAEPDWPAVQRAPGDTWFVQDAIGQPVTAVMQWDGMAWAESQLSHQTLASIDLGTATVGKLTGAFIEAETLEALHFKAGSITTPVLAADAIDGMVVTGTTVRTSPTGARVQLDSTGLQAWNAAGTRTLFASASTGAVELNGAVVRAASANDSARISIETATYSGGFDNSTGVRSMINFTGQAVTGVNAGAIFTTVDANAGATVANEATLAIQGTHRSGALKFISNAGDGVSRESIVELASQGVLRLHSRTSGGLILSADGANIGSVEYNGTAANWGQRYYKQGTWYGEIGSPSAARTANLGLRGIAGLDLIIGTTWMLRNNGSGGNVEVNQGLRIAGFDGGNTTDAEFTSAGWLRRKTSSRRYKRDIAAHTPTNPEAILDLQPVTFRRRDEVIEYRDGETDHEPPTYYGLIAEDVHDAGLHHLVQHDDTGAPNGVRYPEIGVALIPVVARLCDRIANLERLLADSEGATDV